MNKILTLLILALTAISCCSTKKITTDAKTAEAITANCPENVACNWQVQKGKSIVVHTDGTGALYYELQDNPGKTVYIYTYNLKTDQEYQDNFYREEIIFELDNASADFSWSGKQLQQSKMLFGVFCYCKGKAGHYKVNDGTLSKKGKTITADFTASVADQKVTSIVYTAKN